MSANAPVPPPPPPTPGGSSGSALPPTFAPVGARGAHAPRTRPVAAGDGPPTAVQLPAATAGAADGSTQVVGAGSAVPPQRVRYATEPGYGAPAPVGSIGQQAPAPSPNGSRPAYHPPAAAGAPSAESVQRREPTTPASPPSGGAGSGSGGRSGGRRGRRGLGAGWIAFIVIDVLLVVGAVLFALSLAGGDDDPQGTTQSSAPPSAAATDDESAEPAEPTVSETFASESRNITCEMTDLGVTCSIATLASQPAPVDGCDGSIGFRATLDADGVDQPCVPASEQPGPADESVALLDYGTSKTVGDYTCDSEDTGMTCRDDTTGTGFVIARAGISTL
ncbi:hypothetical protein [Cellulosimicrobium arenosum]|uniref:Uncharacterized protein n=1 Tax=Cellulosimicrobium arenosum TaxID=2708133 RepID=A0A927PGR2_9MICO|nr:hypothetical protein [Cellulosimicrobium arenosum]MBD8080597.1 hypothetical protein [Cellulosimicrobium arenosum]